MLLFSLKTYDYINWCDIPDLQFNSFAAAPPKNFALPLFSESGFFKEKSQYLCSLKLNFKDIELSINLGSLLKS